MKIEPIGSSLNKSIDLNERMRVLFLGRWCDERLKLVRLVYSLLVIQRAVIASSDSLAHCRCHKPWWCRSTQRDIFTWTLSWLSCTWTSQSSIFRVDVRASTRQQQPYFTTVSTARTVSHPVRSTALLAKKFAGRARLLPLVPRRIHTQWKWQ